MQTIFDQETYRQIADRVTKISADKTPLWGKMNASQMMHHLNLAMEAPLGKFTPPGKPVLLMRVFKSVLYSDKPFSKGSPTPKGFKVTGEFAFAAERDRVLENLREIFQRGIGHTYKPHAFFGRLTSDQWGKHVYKHTDHHLRQFGV